MKPAGPPSSFPPAVNGTSPPDVIASPQFPPQPLPPGQQYNTRPPPPTSQAQYMNGAPQASGPGRGQMPPMPGKPVSCPNLFLFGLTCIIRIVVDEAKCF